MQFQGGVRERGADPELSERGADRADDDLLLLVSRNDEAADELVVPGSRVQTRVEMFASFSAAATKGGGPIYGSTPLGSRGNFA